MTTTLLVLLVGELLTPFQADFRGALPHAFPDGVPEVALGISAPPGRTVAWVTVRAGGIEVEVVLHTTRIPGDLRRVLRFGAADAPRDKATAAAFALAAMVREREADLQSLEGAAAPCAASEPVVPPPAHPWLLDASVLAGLDFPGLNFGGGLSARLRRETASWLQLGVGVEVGFFSTPATTLIQPALFVEAAVRLTGGRLSTAAVLAGGVTAPVLVRDGLALTTWLPLLRVGAEGRLLVGEHHGLRFGLFAHLVPSALTVWVGNAERGTVGPAWVRPELGYFAEL